jgi:decaprenylphospho-beta-D-erythro-pentofuranosid-2-ulose 2-reductase
MPATRYPAVTPLSPYRKAVLIGASRGLGAALARRLAREGYLLALVGRDAEALNHLCAEINQAAGETRARPYLHDVTAYAEVPDLLEEMMLAMGGLDLFIYNAGVLLPTTPLTYEVEKDLKTMEVNALGAIAWFNAVAPIFQALGAGQIVGISSVAGDRGRLANPAYNASKAALSTYLEALRNRLTRHGVHVLTVKPSFMATDMLKSSPRTFWVASPETAADDIWKALRRRKQTLYTLGRWGLVMLIIRHLPSVIFRRLSF